MCPVGERTWPPERLNRRSLLSGSARIPGGRSGQGNLSVHWSKQPNGAWLPGKAADPQIWQRTHGKANLFFEPNPLDFTGNIPSVPRFPRFPPGSPRFPRFPGSQDRGPDASLKRQTTGGVIGVPSVRVEIGACIVSISPVPESEGAPSAWSRKVFGTRPTRPSRLL
jgi:hypothetical protein